MCSNPCPPLDICRTTQSKVGRWLHRNAEQTSICFKPKRQFQLMAGTRSDYCGQTSAHVYALKSFDATWLVRRRGVPSSKHENLGLLDFKHPSSRHLYKAAKVPKLFEPCHQVPADASLRLARKVRMVLVHEWRTCRITKHKQQTWINILDATWPKVYPLLSFFCHDPLPAS